MLRTHQDDMRKKTASRSKSWLHPPGGIIYLKKGVTGETLRIGILDPDELMNSRTSYMPREKKPKAGPGGKVDGRRSGIPVKWTQNLDKYNSDPISKWSQDWMDFQVRMKNEGQLSQKKINALASIGVVLTEPIKMTQNTWWWFGFEKYKSDPISPWSQKWFATQVRLNNYGLLSQEKITAFASIGVTLPEMIRKPARNSWTCNFEAFLTAQKALPPGTVLSRQSQDKVQRAAANWLASQSFMFRQGLLPLRKARLLLDAGVNIAPSAKDAIRWAGVFASFTKAKGREPSDGSEAPEHERVLCLAIQCLRRNHSRGLIKRCDALMALAEAGVIGPEQSNAVQE